jgi:RNA polymerase sigma-70 factor (ECF subfamily)
MQIRLVQPVSRLSKGQEVEKEAEWIADARINPAAFEPFYLLYRERIHHYMRLRLPSDEDAADATQQVFLKALDALPGYQPRGVPVVVWLFRIARRTAIDHHRRQRPSVSWDALPDRLHPMSTHDPDTMVLRQEMLEHLKVFLTRLKAAERELLALRYAAGLNSQQIAAVLGKRPEAIRKQLSRLLQALKELYTYEY